MEICMKSKGRESEEAVRHQELAVRHLGSWAGKDLDGEIMQSQLQQLAFAVERSGERRRPSFPFPSSGSPQCNAQITYQASTARTESERGEMRSGISIRDVGRDQGAGARAVGGILTPAWSSRDYREHGCMRMQQSR
ncbi:hypothetical protein TWF481_007288 [Arthrobotrys musiformis]|uniref:Uncharacterized protein n=1 Tax=Arthrobotrys musiformis TaxID=47236 RepID=A0AAV9WCM7_9PEZI